MARAHAMIHLAQADHDVIMCVLLLLGCPAPKAEHGHYDHKCGVPQIS